MGGTYKLITVSMLVLGVATGAWLYITWKYASEENEERKLDESRLIYRRESLKKEKEYKSEYYHRLIHDDEFAERVIREKLGYVGENEIVFRFKDSTPLSVNAKTAGVTTKLQQNIDKKETEENVATISEQPVQPEKVEAQVEPEQKSLLRRLFSKTEEKSLADRDIVPQIRIDMSEQKKEIATPEPTQKVAKVESNYDIPKIGIDNAVAEKSKIDSPKKFQAPRVEMYLPKDNVSKSRTPNSIRFRTN